MWTSSYNGEGWVGGKDGGNVFPVSVGAGVGGPPLLLSLHQARDGHLLTLGNPDEGGGEWLKAVTWTSLVIVLRSFHLPCTRGQKFCEVQLSMSALVCPQTKVCAMKPATFSCFEEALEAQVVPLHMLWLGCQWRRPGPAAHALSSDHVCDFLKIRAERSEPTGSLLKSLTRRSEPLFLNMLTFWTEYT